MARRCGAQNIIGDSYLGIFASSASKRGGIDRRILAGAASPTRQAECADEISLAACNETQPSHGTVSCLIVSPHNK